jgi:hypothetical protein
MCSLVSSRLYHSISFPLGFFALDSSFYILGALVGSTSFVELFVPEALHEDLGTIFSLPMFVNPRVAFAMLLLCYAQCPSYLLHIMFPSPNISHHYAKFNTHTIVASKKLLGARSFGDFIGHLLCH